MTLSYEVDDRGTLHKHELPFVIGVVGDFVSQPIEPLARLRDRRFVDISVGSFDFVLAGMRPHLAFSVENKLAGHPDAVPLAIDLEFKSLEDFGPASVSRAVRPLRDLARVRTEMEDLSVRLASDSRLDSVVHRCLTEASIMDMVATEWKGSDGDDGGGTSETIDRLLLEHGWSESPWVNRSYATRIATLVSHARETGLPHSRDAAAIISFAVAEVERAVARQLDVILHHASFQKLEAAWRGLGYLCDRVKHLPQVKIKILNVSKKELLRDLQRAAEYNQSSLYSHVYGEFSVFGGEPFSLLVGLYEIDRNPEDVELLEQVTQVVSAAHCPFFASIRPEMLQLDSFGDLEVPRSLARSFDTSECAKWNSFRRSADSRYIGLVMPRILLRAPHNVSSTWPDTSSSGLLGGGFLAADSRSVPYVESVPRPADLLWGNPAIALAASFAVAFASSDLTDAVFGPESAGLVSDLPVWTTISDEGDSVASCPTEIAITDHRQVELSQLGFIALCHRKGTADAAFFDVPSAYLPSLVTGDDLARSAIHLSGRMENIMMGSRFAHCIKCILRDKFGSFATLSEYASFLDSWLRQYAGDAPEGSTGAPAPLLKSGSIRIEPRGFGHEPQVIATLTPRFKNRSSDVALRIVVSLPQMKEVQL